MSVGLLEVREPLLEIAVASTPDIPAHVSHRAAEVLTEFDPFDESAHVAMARKLHEMGRRAAARRLISEFATAVEEELQVPASQEVQGALSELGGNAQAVVHSLLTYSRNGLTFPNSGGTVPPTPVLSYWSDLCPEAKIQALNVGHLGAWGASSATDQSQPDWSVVCTEEGTF